MIIGSGLLAQAFTPILGQRNDVCLYAAGVSNSACSDRHEFNRERQRLTAALGQTNKTFVYFGTCSVADPDVAHTPYVRHKQAMELLVIEHPQHLIVRLPQIAGHTPNPHTLLNFLYGRIARSESFDVWSNAWRNIIDITDVVTLTVRLIDNPTVRNLGLNIANPRCYPMPEIVTAMERAVGKPAICRKITRGSHYPIDIGAMQPFLAQASVQFDNNYLDRTLLKYYGKQ